jgi:hypothetical protein
LNPCLRNHCLHQNEFFKKEKTYGSVRSEPGHRAPVAIVCPVRRIAERHAPPFTFMTENRLKVKVACSCMGRWQPAFLKNVDDATLRERCEEAARSHATRHPDTPPFASPVHWAAFIATGLAYNSNEIF